MAESLCSSPETTTTLLTGYTPIQNKKLTKRSVAFQNLPPYLHTDGGMICSTHQRHGNGQFSCGQQWRCENLAPAFGPGART